MTKHIVKSFLVICLILLAAQLANAVDALSYKAWKSRQVVDAENRVARTSNKLQILKASAVPEDSKAAPMMASEIQHYDSNLAKARENLEYSRQLQLEDYIDIYLKPFADNDQIMDKVAKSLSPEEVKILLKRLIESSNLSGELAKPQKKTSASTDGLKSKTNSPF